jgi:cytochrome c
LRLWALLLGDGDDREERVKGIHVTVWTALALAASAAMAWAAGDPAAGEKIFVTRKVCSNCHQVGEGAKNFVGPELNGVVGRKAGTVDGYHYSPANKNSGITWDEAMLKKYLKNPREVVPGTKMAFPGLSNDQDIDNVIAYLAQFDADGKKR